MTGCFLTCRAHVIVCVCVIVLTSESHQHNVCVHLLFLADVYIRYEQFKMSYRVYNNTYLVNNRMD